MDIFQSALLAVNNFFAEVLGFLPELLLAILVLFVGWIIAKLLRKGCVKLLTMARVHEAAEAAGIESFLRNGGLQFTTITLLSQLVYWFFMFATFLFALDIVGLAGVQDVLKPIIFYIPKVFIAVIILIFGSLLAKLVQSIISAYLTNIGIPTAKMVAATAHYAILLFVLFIALDQLDIGDGLISSVFQIAFGGLALAFGLAFGLGGKEVAKEISEKIYKSFTR